MFKQAKVSRSLLVGGIFFILLASVFQMLGLGLVIPVLNALVDETKFYGIVTAPVLGVLIRNLPFAPTNHNIFLLMVAIIFVAVVLENITLLLGRYFSILIEKEFNSQLRTQIFEKYINIKRSFFAEQKAVEINTVLTNFLGSVSRTNNNVTNIITQLFFSVIFLFLMFMISWQLTLIALLLLPAIHLITNFFIKKIEISAQNAEQNLLDINNQVDDVFRNIGLVQLTCNQGNEIKKFTKNANSLSKNLANVKLRGYYVPAIVDVFNAAGTLLVVTASIFVFLSFSSFSIGRLLVFFVSLRRFVSNIQQLSGTYVQSVAEMPMLKKVVDYLDYQEPNPIIDGNKRYSTMKAGIQFEKVDFSYDTQTQIVRDINLFIPANKITAIVGPSGAGKTSLVNLIPRFYDPQAGRIQIDGIDIKEFQLATYRKKIAIVSQQAMLFNDTIRGNITYGLGEVSNELLNKSLEQAQLKDLIAKLPMGLDSQVGTQGAYFSGGEIQRLCIARAIIANPDILILDEPTSALDAETERNLELAMKSILPDRTVIIIAHRLVTIRNADQIVFLEEGRIQEVGTFEELTAKGERFAQYCKLQNL